MDTVTESLLDSALDEKLFAETATLLSDWLGARSGVFHWRMTTGSDVEEIGSSKYFSDAQMALYDAHFAADDLWAAAIADPRRANRAQTSDELVSEDLYRQGRLFNEWLRPMGDDSFHCLALSIRTPDFVAEFGFHRGVHQTPFGEGERGKLQACLPALRHVIGFRHRLGQERRRAANLQAALDAAGDAILVMSNDGHLIDGNLAADRLLRDGSALTVCQGRVHPTRDNGLRFGDMLARLQGEPFSSTDFRLERETEGPLIMSVLPVTVEGTRRVVAVVQKQETDQAVQKRRIARAFGLSMAEAEVAFLLARGYAPAAIAEQRHTTISTVRSQIKTLHSKMETSRQAEIITAIHALPRVSGTAH